MDILLFILIVTVVGPLIGAFIGVIHKPSMLFMKNLLSFAAGIMLAISFLELIPQSIGLSSVWLCCIGVLIGALFMYFIDKLIPHLHHTSYRHNHKIKHMAILIFIGMFIHNFPEGMAIAMGGINNIGISLVIALSIAIHDIPEGICTAAPYYFATKKRLKAFMMSASTIIPTLAGFGISYYLANFIPLYFVGFLIAFTAGLMIYISADELIPLSCGNHEKRFSHSTIFSLIIGILFVIILESLVV